MPRPRTEPSVDQSEGPLRGVKVLMTRSDQNLVPLSETSLDLPKMPIPLDARVSVPPHVVHREFPNETVLLNLTAGTYHGLNPVGGVMLRELEASATVGAAIVTLAEQFDQPLDIIEVDVVELCAGLCSRGLIVVHEPAG